LNISLIEFIFYGFITYFSLAMLIITTIKTSTDKTRKLTLVKAMYMIPGIIGAIILAGSGVDIILQDQVISTNATSVYEVLDNTNAIVVLNSTVTQVESSLSVFTLQNPVWVTFHYMIAALMMVFVFIQVLTMFTAKE